MSQQEKFMFRAIELAKEGMLSGEGGPFGAVIVKENQIVAEGFNMVTSTNDPTAHAEVVAIRNACKNLDTFQLDECIIYTSCEPCPMCLGAIYWARPKMVYYALDKHDAAAIDFDDQFIYDEINLEMDQRKIVFKQIMQKEALPVFNLWTEKGDKALY